MKINLANLTVAWGIFVLCLLFSCGGGAGCASPPGPGVFGPQDPGLEQLAQLRKDAPPQFLPLVTSLAGCYRAYAGPGPDWWIYNDNTNPAWDAVQFYETGARVQLFMDSPYPMPAIDPFATCARTSPPWCPESPLGLGWVVTTSRAIFHFTEATQDTSMGWARLELRYPGFDGAPRVFRWNKQLEGPHIDGVW